MLQAYKRGELVEWAIEHSIKGGEALTKIRERLKA